MQPYTRYSCQNVDTLPSIAEDETNLTRHDRTISDYSENISFNGKSILSIIKSLSKSGRKIRILDCGAGAGEALNGILMGRYGKSIEKCVGISLHYFQNVKSLLKNHGNKVEWIIGPAEKVLPDLTEKFDLIFDVYGAYHYSPERSLLVEQYHRVLDVGGKAAILVDAATSNVVEGKGSLEQYYINQDSSVFSTYNDGIPYYNVFNIEKKSESFPAESFAVSGEVEYKASVIIPRTTDELKRGNAWRPSRVHFKPLKSGITKNRTVA